MAAEWKHGKQKTSRDWPISAAKFMAHLHSGSAGNECHFGTGRDASHILFQFAKKLVIGLM